jgi:hypothetical protein
MKRLFIRSNPLHLGLLAALATLFFASSAGALDVAVAPTDAEVDVFENADAGDEVVRDTARLTDELRPRPHDDVDVADTAMTFTNLTGHNTRVLCAGFNKNGRVIGRKWLRVPRLGLRYLLASDLSRDADFVGHVQCAARAGVIGSAVFLGPDITDLPAINPDGPGRIRFPLVATY